MKPQPIRPRPSPSEEGYILIAVIFLLALFVIAMSIAVPNISKQIERDREVETMHRGKQYVRALRLYYKKFGNYPMNVDALVNTNQIRFLRKKYKDPSTGKDEWKPIHMGEQKQPTAYGFFGKPMASSLMGGMGANCGLNGLGPGASDSSSSSLSSSSSSSLNSSSLSSSSLGSSGLNTSMGMGTNSPIGGCPTDSSSSGATPGGSGASANPNDPSNHR
jgi:type II secretory pathway pseudopilin PulG